MERAGSNLVQHFSLKILTFYLALRFICTATHELQRGHVVSFPDLCAHVGSGNETKGHVAQCMGMYVCCYKSLARNLQAF